MSRRDAPHGEVAATVQLPTAVAGLTPLDEVMQRLDAVISTSTADETELVWFEIRRGAATTRSNRIRRRPREERSVLVRVHEGGRVAVHRTNTGTIGELENAVRLAVAQSRIEEPIPGLPHLPSDTRETAEVELFDSRIAGLSRRLGEQLLEELKHKNERATLIWAEAQVLVVNSRGVRRSARVTSAHLAVQCSPKQGAGSAISTARTLGRLNPEAIFERARLRHTNAPCGKLTTGPTPVVLAPEATIALLDLLNRTSFSARSYQNGSSFLREHLGVQVFDRRIHLYDDGTDPTGLPFPFDLEGTAKRRVDLIAAGSPKTPALDQRKAAQLGLPPTGHAITGGDARAENVFLEPGDSSEAQLIAAAADGLWIGRLDRVECYDTKRVQMRAIARNVRAFRSGELAEPLPDLVWDESVLRLLSNVLDIGSDRVSAGGDRGISGGVTAPAMALGDVAGLHMLG